MAHQPYSIYRRPGINRKYPIWYVQFWDHERSQYVTGKSLSILAQRLKLDLDALPPLHTKAGARIVAEECMRRGLTFVTPGQPKTVGAYLELFWDWEKSDYIRGCLARRKNGIGKAYVQACKSWANRYIIPSLGKVSLERLSTGQIEKWFINLRSSSNLNSQTLNRVLQTLKGPLREALRLGWISKDPSAPILPLGVEIREKGILNRTEVSRLLSLEWQDKQAYAAFCLGLAGGLRLGEIVGLKREYLQEGAILVAHSYCKKVGLKGTKTNKSRFVTLPDRVLDLLRVLAESNPHGEEWVFWRKDTPGKPLDPKVIEHGFYKALDQIGIPDDRGIDPSPDSRQSRNLSFHSLRHWFTATLHGVLPDAKLRLLTGHSSAAMTARYDHITEMDRATLVQAQTERIASLFPSE